MKDTVKGMLLLFSYKSLLEPLAFANKGNWAGPNAPAPGEQVSKDSCFILYCSVFTSRWIYM